MLSFVASSWAKLPGKGALLRLPASRPHSCCCCCLGRAAGAVSMSSEAWCATVAAASSAASMGAASECTLPLPAQTRA